MTSYHQLELLIRHRVQTLMAEAASEQLAAESRLGKPRRTLRQCIASVISAFGARLEPTPMQVELIEACPTLSEWLR